MKKTIPSKLKLNKETVRKLRDGELGNVAGGWFKESDFCSATCSDICNATSDCPVVTKGNCSQVC